MIVVYTDAMIAPPQHLSPSAHKPRAVLRAWQALDADLQLIEPTPVSLMQFYAAHQREFVDGVFAHRRMNGFGTLSSEVSRTLPYTSGAMLTAARLAIQNRCSVAAPTGGFHHAMWDHAAAFCTFNGLIVTALALRADNPKIRVGILDYDYHFGDGTTQIIAHLKLNWIVHYSAGKDYVDRYQADKFLSAIDDHIALMQDCDVVLYQAGADPHIDDPLGGFLTTMQLAMRDFKVFDGLHRRGIPVAWNLAGGYQEPLTAVIRIHQNTYAMATMAAQ